jgi:alkylation response protein AidB-like acyl-CoA dehydrogenase
VVAEVPIEGVDDFRQRVRVWMRENMPRAEFGHGLSTREGVESEFSQHRVERARFLQRTLFEGGFAGIAFPHEYGGLGLTGEHQRAFAEESAGYESPLWLNMSTLGVQAPTILDFGTDEQKAKHVPAILRGDEFWCQLLSEPSGGSDLAGVLTRADRDGDNWVLNGSKIWTSGAHLRDFGLCLARTDWDAPKHKGVTMFIVDFRAPGVDIVPLRLANGVQHFCQEFFEDVALPASAVLGDVNEGWTVARRMMVHERNMVGGGSPYVGVARSRDGSHRGNGRLTEELMELGRSDDAPTRPEARRLLAEAHTLTVVRNQLVRRISAGQRLGALPGSAGSLLKLVTSTASLRISEISMQLAATNGVVWKGSADHSGGRYGNDYLVRQTIAIGGGTSEIQRNIISENLLGMPREPSYDKDVPFRSIMHNQSSSHRDRST